MVPWRRPSTSRWGRARSLRGPGERGPRESRWPSEPGRRRPARGALSSPAPAAPNGPTGSRLIRTLARGLVALFYRRVDVVGAERVPPRGPVIVCANHQNALVDPMLLLATIPRMLVPLAKAPLFHHPIIGPFI